MEKTFLKHRMSGPVPDDSFIIRFKPLNGKDYPYFTNEAEAQRVSATCYPLLSSKCRYCNQILVCLLCQFFLLTTLPSPTLPKATSSSKIPDSVYVSKMPACSFEFCCRAMKIDGL